MFQAIAIHHAKPEHVDAFLAFMQRVIDRVGEAPGLIEFRGWRDVQSSRLMGLSRWESAEAFEQALPTIMSMTPERRPEWSDRPDEVLMFTVAV
jgi:quinol monooxygenase YgiN